ncbi:hypothetical protein [Marinomonas sp. GJ51-6]|uniref:hypothetical protein n=1 Tax=Marinomonas sp. GJ51-6 TaxID=2992802 RepID=UPI0029350FB9|nr:hypothetical protein [Marinomonas sp. GJ51-6]WOD06189.1 hypothetical protein ONZ50_10620 [Marinomonas sp. GJ51-6]
MTEFKKQYSVPVTLAADFLLVQVAIDIKTETYNNVLNVYNTMLYRSNVTASHHINQFIAILYKIPDEHIVAQCLWAIVFWLPLDNSQRFNVAKLFYGINRLEACLKQLLEIKLLDKKPIHFTYLLIVAVSETFTFSRNQTWDQAKRVLDNLVDRDHKYGWFGQFWIDYFDKVDPLGPIRGDRNYNVNIESTMQRFLTFYRLQKAGRSIVQSASLIPKVVIEFPVKSRGSETIAYLLP